VASPRFGKLRRLEDPSKSSTTPVLSDVGDGVRGEMTTGCVGGIEVDWIEGWSTEPSIAGDSYVDD